MKKKPRSCYIEVPVTSELSLRKVARAVVLALESEKTDLLECADHLLIQVKFVKGGPSPVKGK